MEEPGLIIIGGSGRNVGKTTLACKIISELVQKGNTVAAIKLSNIRPNDQGFHGYHEKGLQGEYEIYEEGNSQGSKDSQLMLAAGATQSFFIRAGEAHVKNAFGLLSGKLAHVDFLVCESGSLRDNIEPDTFIMVVSPGSGDKKNVAKNINRADHLANAMDDGAFDDIAKRVADSQHR
jgi:signal recognition particle GTPase